MNPGACNLVAGKVLNLSPPAPPAPERASPALFGQDYGQWQPGDNGYD